MDDKELMEIFKKNQSGFDEQPNEEVWNKIETKLEQSSQKILTKKKQRAVWMSYAAAIILILLVPTFVILYNLNQNNNTNLIAKNYEPKTEVTKTPEHDFVNEEKILNPDKNKNEILDNKQLVNNKKSENLSTPTGKNEKIVARKEQSVQPNKGLRKDRELTDSFQDKLSEDESSSLGSESSFGKKVTPSKPNNIDRDAILDKKSTALGYAELVETNESDVPISVVVSGKITKPEETEGKGKYGLSEVSSRLSKSSSTKEFAMEDKFSRPLAASLFKIINNKKVFVHNWRLIGIYSPEDSKISLPVKQTNSILNDGLIDQNNITNNYQVNELNEILIVNTENTKQSVYYEEIFNQWKSDIGSTCESLNLSNHSFKILHPNDQSTFLINYRSRNKSTKILIHNFTVECYTKGKLSKKINTGYAFESID